MKRNAIFGIPIISIVGVVAACIAGASLVWIVVNQNATTTAEHTAYILSCKHTNALAHGLIDPSVTRSRKAFEATVNSKFSTAQQKTVAEANLKALEHEVKTFLNPVANDRLCVWPPRPIPTIHDSIP